MAPDPPLRILILHNRYVDPGGEDVVVAWQTELLRAAGHTVEVHEARNADGPGGIQPFLLAPWNPFAARDVERVARAFDPDVAYVHNTWFSLSPSVVRVLQRLGIPTLLALHNYRLVCGNAQFYRDGGPCTLCVDDGPLPGVVNRCYQGFGGSLVAAATIQAWRVSGLIDTIDAYVLFNDWARDMMVRGGLPADRVHVIPHATEDPGPRPAPPSQAEDYLWVGRLVEEKGIVDLVEAWDVIGQGRRLVVVGDGPLRGDVEHLATGRNVVIRGRLEKSQVYELMMNSRCLVMSSRGPEAFGLVLIEAMAASLPVIVSRTLPISPTVERNSSGWVADDIASWRRAVAESLDDDELDRRSANARRQYISDHTPKRLVEELVSLLRSVAKPGLGAELCGDLG